MIKKMWDKQNKMNKCMLALGGSAFLTAAIRSIVPREEDEEAKPIQVNSIISIGV